MKKIFTLAAILFSLVSFAAEPPRPNAGKVAIRSSSDVFLQVFIDGKQYNLNRSGFVMDDIRPGRHRIEVFQVNNYGMFRKKPQRIYSSNTVVKPWETLNININRNEQVYVDSRVDRDNRYDSNFGRGRNNGYKR
jgi:hypothetical protein